MAALRPGHREPEPARLRRRQPRPAGAGAPLWSSSAFCRRRIRGRSSATSRSRSPTWRATASRPPSSARSSTSCGRSTSCTRGERRGRHAARRPHRVVRAGVPHADGGAGGVRRRARERQPRRQLYGLDDPATDMFGRQCLHGPAAGRARRAVRAGLSHADEQALELPALGPARRPARGAARRTALATDQPIAGLAERPQGARPARRHAGRLGRRIRPHADRRRDRRPRASSVRLHDVAGRRRRARAA